MKKVLLQFENKYWLLQPVTLVLLAVWVGILLFAIGNGKDNLKAQLQQQEKLILSQQEKQAAHISLMDSFITGKKNIQAVWENPTNAYMIGDGHAKRYFIKKPLALAALSSGHCYLHHQVQTISTSPDAWFMTMKKAAQLNNPHNTIFGNMDVSFVLLYLFPLLIIAFNFSILSAEKEEGRLPILAAQGLSVKQLLWHKTGFRFVVLTGSTLLVLCCSFWASHTPNTSIPIESLGYVGVIILYSAWWHALCVWVNLLKKGSDFNAGLLFTTWITGVMVVPALTTILITSLQPTVGKMHLMDEVREKLTEYDRKNAQILDAYYTDHPELVSKDSGQLMPAYMYKYMIKYKHTLEALQPVMDDYKEQAADQAKTAVYLSALSPAMLLQETADEYSGNAQTQFLNFEKQADNLVREWNGYFLPKSLANQNLSIEEYRALPAPVFKTTISGFKTYYLMACMLCWLAMMIVLIQTRFKKYSLL